jgi:transcription elongation factor GreA
VARATGTLSQPGRNCKVLRITRIQIRKTGRRDYAPKRQNAQMSTPENQGEPITEAGLAALKAEIGQLETVARREVAARILEARGHGDLKENAEYHAAKEDQAHLETRILRLRQRWRNAVVVEVVESPGATFAFGRSAEVRDEDTGEVHTWTIVGAAEADRTRGKLSIESPVAKALLDQARGATVEVPTPRGARRLTIERIF